MQLDMKIHFLKQGSRFVTNARSFVVFVTICLCFASLVKANDDESAKQTQPTTTGKPNFVIVIGDDHGVYHSSAYGSAEYKTPNMKALAEDGIRLTNAYAASPACGPSRAAMFTGLMPYRNGIVGNHETELRPDVKSLVPNLIALGYDVVFRGKVAHGKAVHHGGYIPPEVTVIPGNGKLIKLDRVEAYLENRSDPDRPLALFIGSTDTHRPWPAPDSVRIQPDEVKVPERTFDTPETRSELTRYATAVDDTDRVLGKTRELVRKYLDVDNTLLMYTSDHGQAWPFGKWSLYETGLRVPMIVAFPGRIKPGTTSDAMVSLIDLLPTLIDFGGGDVPDGLDGSSLKDVLTATTNVHRSITFGTHKGDKDKNVYPIRSVRVGDWKYIRNLHPEFYYTTHMDQSPPNSGFYNRNWPSWVEAAKTNPEAAAFLRDYHSSPGEELYKVKDDPFEQHDLAENPEHAETLRKLGQLIDVCMKEVHDDRSLSGPPRLLKDYTLPAVPPLTGK